MSFAFFSEAIRAHPELALFLAVGLGTALGRLRLGGVRLGPVLGCLLAGIVVGQLDLEVPVALKSALFLLFLFAMGYRTGPLFFRSFESTALPQIVLTLLFCATALGTGWAVSFAFGFDAGTAGGLIAGALTESAALGTASDGLANLGLSSEKLELLGSRQTVAFAVTYLIGTAAAIVLLAHLAPRLLRVDLAAECQRLEREMGADVSGSESVSIPSEFASRAYEIGAAAAGRSIADLEARFGEQRAFVERVRRAGRILDTFEPVLRLEAGDRVVVTALVASLLGRDASLLGREVDDRELLAIPVVEANAVLTNRRYHGRTLEELIAELGARGVFLRRLSRGGAELPIMARTIVSRGDVFELYGARPDIERVVRHLGYVEWTGTTTDLVATSLAILVGGLLGLPSVAFGKLEIGLSLYVGVLLGGLTLGWMRSIRPYFGSVPGPALWLLETFGLSGFLALVGIGAGPAFVAGVSEAGAQLFVGGLVVVSVPHLVTLLVGRFLLKVHPGVLIGICCGAGTAAPALGAVQDVARSRVPALGYGVSYALGNVLLALWGGLIVSLIGT